MRAVATQAVFFALTSFAAREAHGQGVGERVPLPSAAATPPARDEQTRPEQDTDVALPPTGEAGSPRPGESPSPTPASTWYGWQTLVLDGFTGALVLASGSWESGLLASSVTLALGAPLIHVAHGEGVNAGASFVLRVTLPFMGVLAGVLADSQACSKPHVDGGTCIPPGAIVGGLAGIVAASALDAAVLGRPHARPTVAPAATALHRGATVGLAGTF